MRDTAQIPFELFAPEAPSFKNFVVGANAEAVAVLAALATGRADRERHAAYVIWGGPGLGKTHLLAAFAQAAGDSGLRVLCLTADAPFPEDAFPAVDMLCVDNADRLSTAQQGWLFTAFNHVANSGGSTVATGASAPGLWPIRDDIRTRMASGLAMEILPIPQDGMVEALSAYAKSRGFVVSNEVLTYLLSHARRDLKSLCQTLAGIDRVSLAQKRAVTIPLLRAYLSQLGDSDTP